MSRIEDEEALLRSVALQNAQSILVARQRAEQELLTTKEALEQSMSELARSLATVRATLEATKDGILVTDGTGHVTDFNRSYVEIWGIPQALLETKDHRQVIEFCSQLVGDSQPFIARIEEIYATSPPESFDVQHLTDGRILERTSKVQFAEQLNIGRVWIFRDVTEARRLELGRFRLAAIVESSDDAIISKTLEGIITSWN
ncbi:MAG: PAS-domain containing protein, partial [Planctomycetota bacterium]|nr:PAS-domain containing protein [Planctomycetota bacterium]